MEIDDTLIRDYGISQEDVRAAIGTGPGIVSRRSYLIQTSLWCFMSGQSTPGSTGEQERSVNKLDGLTPEERLRLEESMRRHEKLMKRLAEM
jgi:hypothetical protein